MAIAKAGTDTYNEISNFTNTFSHTLVAGSERLIIVGFCNENADVMTTSSVTYGGVAMTMAVEQLLVSGSRNLVGIYYLLEASLPANGSNTVSVVMTGTSSSSTNVAYCAQYTGVAQQAPEATDSDSQTSGTTITNTVSPSTGAWAFSAVVVGQIEGGSWTHNEGQVELVDGLGNLGGVEVASFAELRSANGETSLSSTCSGTVNRVVRAVASFAVSSGSFDPMTRTTIYQINTGGSAVSPYIADQFFSGGTTANTANAITIPGGLTNPAPQGVYQTERYGASTYTITGLTVDKRYFVRLHFCEIYWTAAGSRVFNVSINGTTVLSNFDIYVAAGNAQYTAVIREFYTVANSSGQIVIEFTTVTDNATIEGIEILTAYTNVWVNVSGTWKAVTDVYVNVSGTWELKNTGSVNVSGTWKQVGE